VNGALDENDPDVIVLKKCDSCGRVMMVEIDNDCWCPLCRIVILHEENTQYAMNNYMIDEREECS
jgi:hypothetical protein